MIFDHTTPHFPGKHFRRNGEFGYKLSHANNLPLAAHLFYLEDAKGLLSAGADFIAHSVRDAPVDDELIQLLRETGVCYSPTLTREVSTFVYASEPEFFSDPFFLAHADSSVLDALRTPEKQQQYRDSPTAPRYKEALRMAQAAASVPSAVLDEDIEALKKHFDEDQIVVPQIFQAVLNRRVETAAHGRRTGDRKGS